jgi:hypothetical protein
LELFSGSGALSVSGDFSVGGVSFVAVSVGLPSTVAVSVGLPSAVRGFSPVLVSTVRGFSTGGGRSAAAEAFMGCAFSIGSGRSACAEVFVGGAFSTTAGPSTTPGRTPSTPGAPPRGPGLFGPRAPLLSISPNDAT